MTNHETKTEIQSQDLLDRTFAEDLRRPLDPNVWMPYINRTGLSGIDAVRCEAARIIETLSARLEAAEKERDVNASFRPMFYELQAHDRKRDEYTLQQEQKLTASQAQLEAVTRERDGFGDLLAQAYQIFGALQHYTAIDDDWVVTVLDAMSDPEAHIGAVIQLMPPAVVAHLSNLAAAQSELTQLRSEIAELKKPVGDAAETWDVIANLRRASAFIPKWGMVDGAIDLIRRLHRELQDARGKDRDERQAKVFDWGCRAFGNDQMRSPPQRALRLMEESIELAQAVFCDKDQIHRLVDYVYSRPVGTVESELGGVSVCLLALAECVRVNADEMEVREVARILSKPIEHFTKRNAEKNDAGFDALSNRPKKTESHKP